MRGGIMKNLALPDEIIGQKIFILRGQRIMLSTHIAKLYGVSVKILVQAVKRNIERFPEDFMFQLTWNEAESLRSQIVTLNNIGGKESRSQNVTLKRGLNIKYLPYAFTEQGVAMLSSVLRSRKAIQVNISIMRTFMKFREMFATHKDVIQKLNALERKTERHDKEIKVVFDAIRKLMMPAEQPKRRIGFRVGR